MSRAYIALSAMLFLALTPIIALERAIDAAFRLFLKVARPEPFFDRGMFAQPAMAGPALAYDHVSIDRHEAGTSRRSAARNI